MLKYAPYLLLLPLFTAFSCEPCRYVDCYNEAFLRVEYLSLTDSSNLYRTGVLDLDSLKIRVLERPDSLPVEIPAFHSIPPDDQTDFSIYTISANLAGFLLSPRAGITDTLWVNLTFGKKSKCCGGEIKFDNGLLNGRPIRLSDLSVLKIYK